jgi:hypothetical protein
MSIGELWNLIRQRTTTLNKLRKERRKVASRLAEIDREIAGIGRRSGGGGGGGGGGRGRNAKSLVATLEEVLGKNGKAMSVGDIMAAVESAGYRSGSANFRAIINQTLIKEKRFQSAGRGMYQLKK